MREIPKEKILSEQVRSDLRNEVENELREKNVNVKEIRMREVGFALKNNSFSLPFTQNSFLNKHLRLNITKYKASDGNEYFLEIVNKNNILFGLLRLRLFKRNKTTPFTNASQFSKMHKKMLLKNSNLQFQSEKIAIIRELHIYGKSLRIGWRENQTNEIRGIIAQHLGFGKLLIGEAEKICKKNGFEKLIIISGVGVREYYRKLGYELKGSYMVKDL
jgi:elongator complex protein 3